MGGAQFSRNRGGICPFPVYLVAAAYIANLAVARTSAKLDSSTPAVAATVYIYILKANITTLYTN